MYVLACVYMWVARENWGSSPLFWPLVTSWYSHMLLSSVLFMNLLRQEHLIDAGDMGGGPYPVRIRGDPRVQA